MTAQEAADALGLTAMEIRELVECGILPARKTGQEYQIDREEVAAYKKSKDQYEARMGEMVRASVRFGGYDLRFPTGR